jgi:hypothetical protein
MDGMQIKRRWLPVGIALALAAALMGFLPSHLFAAGPAAVTASYQSSPLKSNVLTSSKAWGSAVAGAATKAPVGKNDPLNIPFRSPGNLKKSATANGAGKLPQVSSSSLAEGALAQNFDALSDTQNKAIAGFHDTPPDQGLCVGYLDNLGGKVTIEAVNSIFGIFSPSGTLISAFPQTAGFGDPNAFSDPRCFYDTTTNSFYMTVISCAVCGPPGTADTVNDVLVVNRSGVATTYQFSSSFGGACFGDQPHTGYDNHALYIATDEFCGPTGNDYLGALLIGISKPQLAAQVASPNAVQFGLLSLGSVPILTLEPAFGNDSGTEYLLNSFPFDQFGNSNSISNTLGFWKVTGDEHITTGSGTVTLSGKIITSETYAFPVPAASTGDGSTPVGSPSFVISEPFLEPDDSRMLQVQLVKDDEHGLQLYASLDSAVNIPGDPSARDGAAWFVLNPEKAKITSQGYVAVKGAYLLYPAILHTHEGTTALAFTITSPTINPSAAYAVRKSESHSFSSVKVASAGTAAHVSYADVLFGRGRWGDYSAEELDPNGVDIWSATEYIGGNGAADLIDNWGTRIWDVTGDH